jgi:hypothetical protein
MSLLARRVLFPTMVLAISPLALICQENWKTARATVPPAIATWIAAKEDITLHKVNEDFENAEWPTIPDNGNRPLLIGGDYRTYIFLVVGTTAILEICERGTFFYNKRERFADLDNYVAGSFPLHTGRNRFSRSLRAR